MNEPDGFSAFWKSYPKKVGKGAAVKAWVKQGLSTNQFVQGRIAVALEWQSKQRSWREDDGKFVPHPSTYLNRWQWEDEPPAPQQVSYSMDCPHEPSCSGRNECHVKQQIQRAKAS